MSGCDGLTDDRRRRGRPIRKGLDTWNTVFGLWESRPEFIWFIYPNNSTILDSGLPTLINLLALGWVFAETCGFFISTKFGKINELG
jgi:hypothetical protein